MVNALYIGKNALTTNQAALTVVSNNIANVNTDGYSKQRVNLISVTDNSIATTALKQAQLGNGVDIASISRYRDAFVDGCYRDSVSSQMYYETICTKGLTLESLSNEFAGSGLSSYLNSFFDAANNLSLYPTEITMKTDFVQNASNLAGTINTLYSQLAEARAEMVGDVENPITLETCQANQYVKEINQLLDDIAKVNESIIYQHNTNVGASSGLLDQRDALLDQLAEYIPIDVETKSNGGANVLLGDVQLVGGSQVNAQFQIGIGDENNPAKISLVADNDYVFADDAKELIGQGGKLGAILTLGGDSGTEVTVKSMIDNLDAFVNEFAKQVNALQLKYEAGPPAMTSACYDSKTGELKNAVHAIFSTSDGESEITAKNICVNPNIVYNPSEIATAYVQVETDPDTGEMTLLGTDEIGNNYIAQAMVDLRDVKLAALNQQTLEEYNTSITTDFGSKLANAKVNYETQETIKEATYTQRESIMGVNIEEELVDLVKYQRAYESSARIFSVANEILQTLVNLGR